MLQPPRASSPLRRSMHQPCSLSSQASIRIETPSTLYLRQPVYLHHIRDTPPLGRNMHPIFFFPTRPASHLYQSEPINCAPRRPKTSATLASLHSTYSFSRQDTQCHAPSITISIDHSAQNQTRKKATLKQQSHVY